jgi:hypothetical protein
MRPEDWRAQAETRLEVFIDDIAPLDAAGESVRHAWHQPSEITESLVTMLRDARCARSSA